MTTTGPTAVTEPGTWPEDDDLLRITGLGIVELGGTALLEVPLQQLMDPVTWDPRRRCWVPTAMPVAT